MASGLDLSRVLVPAPRVEGMQEPPIVPDFVAALEQLGLEVTRVDAYVTRPTKDTDVTSGPLSALSRGDIDVIALTSVGEADALCTLVGGAPRLEALLSRRNGPPVVLGCFGPVTASGVQRLGLTPTLHATQFGRFAGFVDALAAHFR